MNLITMGKSVSPKVEFKKLLSSLRSKSESLPSLEEITREVELVRASRYANKKK